MQKDPVKSVTKGTDKLPLTSQLQEVRNIIAGFSALLLKETEALKKADFKTVDTLQAGKKIFARQYHDKVKELSIRKEDFRGLDPALRERLLEERNRFTTILSDNAYALERAQNSVKRLVNNILDAARRNVLENQQTNYSRAGKAMSCKSSSLSLATDQSL
ncbi:MAG: hypothetical protein K8R48_05905 [Alphaproteobacteria bacterium]|nr:hypothetical protein [Alphaproteobacteria bacterium]